MQLDSVRILDLSRLLPGPYATQLLADAGADVIKVEDTDAGITRGYRRRRTGRPARCSTASIEASVASPST